MAKPSTSTSKIDDSMPFEQALKELESIVRKLEGGTADLDASIADYVRGTELKTFCQQKLADARTKVETILKAQDGNVTTKPLDAA
jgi:exodeoxyribonuclease VII small subunit